MPKISSYGGATPVLTDLLYGVAAGVSDSFTITAVRDLLEANLVNPVISGNLAWTTDLFLERDAANILAQRNGTNSQEFRVYNTRTNASNYERLKIAWETNVLVIGTEAEGTGSDRVLEIATASNLVLKGGLTNSIRFFTSGTERWKMKSTGVFAANSDNAYDIGLAGTQRPRDLFLGSKIELSEMTPPGVGPANTARLYADVSSTKTRLMVIFQTGSAIQLAIEV